MVDNLSHSLKSKSKSESVKEKQRMTKLPIIINLSRSVCWWAVYVYVLCVYFANIIIRVTSPFVYNSTLSHWLHSRYFSGESAQLCFVVKNFGRISSELGEFRLLFSRRISWFEEISPNSEEIRPKILGRNPFRARKIITVLRFLFVCDKKLLIKRKIK
jgi:hypothetical protein